MPVRPYAILKSSVQPRLGQDHCRRKLGMDCYHITRVADNILSYIRRVRLLDPRGRLVCALEFTPFSAHHYSASVGDIDSRTFQMIVISCTYKKNCH